MNYIQMAQIGNVNVESSENQIILKSNYSDIDLLSTM